MPSLFEPIWYHSSLSSNIINGTRDGKQIVGDAALPNDLVAPRLAPILISNIEMFKRHCPATCKGRNLLVSIVSVRQ